MALNKHYLEDPTILEIGADEAGRGPLFGRVYAAAVILPKDPDTEFDFSQMKDSKKFHSKKKIAQVAEYIKTNAVAWSVAYEDESVIDKINILQATQSAMHKAIKSCIAIAEKKALHDGRLLPTFQLIIDGNYFNSITSYDKTRGQIKVVPHVCIEGGDNKYAAIAAASILAKVSRDTYIEDLCRDNPELNEKYGILSNKGYGARKHLDGIKQYGITILHRRSFGPCKEYGFF
jgi:ribonuclease HII